MNNARKLCDQKAIFFNNWKEKKSAIDMDIVASTEDVMNAFSFNIKVR